MEIESILGLYVYNWGAGSEWYYDGEGFGLDAGGGVLVRGRGDTPEFSTNHGASWSFAENKCGRNNPHSFCFMGDGQGFAIGGNYSATFTVCETTDYGRTWVRKFMLPPHKN